LLVSTYIWPFLCLFLLYHKHTLLNRIWNAQRRAETLLKKGAIRTRLYAAI